MLTKSITLVQGVFDPKVFDKIKKNKPKVFILEGRPYLDAAKESSKECLKRKLTPTVIADNMAGFFFYKKYVKEVWVSYQIADKKGAFTQTGGLILGVLAKHHKIPVYLYPSKEKLKMMGKPSDIFQFNGERVAPPNVAGYVPLVEWVPKKYITKIHE